MAKYEITTDASVHAFLEMELQVYAQQYLHRKHERECVCEGSMDIRRELSPFVFVAEEVCHYGKDNAEALQRHMPSRPDNLGRVSWLERTRPRR